jgi:hypothetical protein
MPTYRAPAVAMPSLPRRPNPAWRGYSSSHDDLEDRLEELEQRLEDLEMQQHTNELLRDD